jgi:hypothetical protein
VCGDHELVERSEARDEAVRGALTCVCQPSRAAAALSASATGPLPITTSLVTGNRIVTTRSAATVVWLRASAVGPTSNISVPVTSAPSR